MMRAKSMFVSMAILSAIFGSSSLFLRFFEVPRFQSMINKYDTNHNVTMLLMRYAAPDTIEHKRANITSSRFIANSSAIYCKGLIIDANNISRSVYNAPCIDIFEKLNKFEVGYVINNETFSWTSPIDKLQARLNETIETSIILGIVGLVSAIVAILVLFVACCEACSMAY